jgi:hypothetical protein
MSIRRTLFIVALLLAAAAPTLTPIGQRAAETRTLVGTWRVVSHERGDVGQAMTAVPNAIGQLITDTAGHFIEIVTRSGRPANMDPIEQFRTYRGLWGTYVADAAASRLTLRVSGDVDPRMLGREVARTFAWDNGRLVITEAAAGTTTRTTWARVAEMEVFPPYLEEVVGFWQWTSAGMVNAKGTMVREVARDPGVIVYTPTGLMSVLYLPAPGPNRPKAFAAAIPNADEARNAMRDIPSYFASYVIQPRSRTVIHYQLGPLTPGNAGTYLERNFDITGSQLVLRFPPTMLNGEQVRNTLFLKRLSGLAQMWPDRPRT